MPYAESIKSEETYILKALSLVIYCKFFFHNIYPFEHSASKALNRRTPYSSPYVSR